MLALSSEHWIAINLVLEGRQPCARKSALLHSGVNLETLGTLENMGIFCRWKTANGNVWTLTPFAAKVLGVELVEHVEPASEKGFTCRWEFIGKQLRPLRIPASWRSLSISNPDALVAPADPEGYLCDESTGERILLFGKFPIKIDSRLARTKRRRRRAG